MEQISNIRLIHKTKTKHLKLIQQKLMGMCVLMISTAILFIMSNGQTQADTDGTVLLLLIPFGLCLLFSKQIII